MRLFLLGKTTIILPRESSSQIIDLLNARFPFTPKGCINWDKVLKKYTVTKLNEFTHFYESGCSFR
ncbi:hypothetical protein DOT_0938 [Desulfosporosinus sp. OT]|nr:hypothetical protein DOT_0938 [Desulfosporosinus sp. OT]